MTIRVYLDNNATTRPHPAVIAAMRKYEEELYLNPSSAAGELLGAARPLADVRRSMTQLLRGSDDDRIVITSGATEANAWAFHATPAGGHIVTSQVEHTSILAASAAARQRGHPVEMVGVDPTGLIRSEDLAAKLRPDTKLVSLQLANNETGVIQPLEALARIVRATAPSALIHTDATQAVGRVAIDLAGELADIDLLSFSAHKFNGPKGIGGLFIRDGIEIEALIPGEQEGGHRGGTSNVPAAAGLAEAARIAYARLGLWRGIAARRDRLESAILSACPGAEINAVIGPRLPNTSSVTIPGIDADDLVERLALQGICIATGAACTAGATTPSHVLTAMGLSPLSARSTLRVSLSVDTTDTELEQLLVAMSQELGSLFAKTSLAPIDVRALEAGRGRELAQ